MAPAAARILGRPPGTRLMSIAPSVIDIDAIPEAGKE